MILWIFVASDLTAQCDNAADFKKQIDTVRHILQDAQRDAAEGVINKKSILTKSSPPEGPNTLHLQVKLYTGEVVDKYFTGLRARTGHTFKKTLKDTLKS